MFTGIIEEIGIIEDISFTSTVSRITVSCLKVLEKTEIGDSISTNGVCLTIIERGPRSFKADVMSETLNRSNLGLLKKGDKVNLERALTLESRLGGHMVSGHIDGIGEIIEIKEEGISTWVTIRCKSNILKYIIEKGSIAIDGVSLTVASVNNHIFKVSIIPQTAKETILLSKKIGDKVNLECDLVGKYIERFLKFNSEEKNNITEEFLKDNGFI